VAAVLVVAEPNGLGFVADENGELKLVPVGAVAAAEAPNVENDGFESPNRPAPLLPEDFPAAWSTLERNGLPDWVRKDKSSSEEGFGWPPERYSWKS